MFVDLFKENTAKKEFEIHTKKFVPDYTVDHIVDLRSKKVYARRHYSASPVFELARVLMRFDDVAGHYLKRESQRRVSGCKTLRNLLRY